MRTTTTLLVAGLLAVACVSGPTGDGPSPTGSAPATSSPSAEDTAVGSPDPSSPASDGGAFAPVEPHPVSADPPPTFAAILDGGRVSILDTATLRVLREVARYDDPDAADDGEGAFGTYAEELTYHPSGERLLVGVCCEPAVGWAEVVDLATGEPTGDGFHGVGHAYGPDGRVAFTVGSVLHLRAADGTEASWPPGAEDPFSPGESLYDPAWSPDGARVVVLRDSEEVGSTEVIVLDAATLEEVGRRAADGPFTYVSPVFRRDGAVLVARVRTVDGVEVDHGAVVFDPATFEVLGEFPYGGVVWTQRYDQSHTWLLTTYLDGSAEWRGLGGSGRLESDQFLDTAWWSTPPEGP